MYSNWIEDLMGFDFDTFGSSEIQLALEQIGKSIKKAKLFCLKLSSYNFLKANDKTKGAVITSNLIILSLKLKIKSKLDI